MDDRLNVLQRISHLGFWEMRTDDQSLVFSDQAAAILGIEQNNRHLPLDAFLSMVDPGHRSRVVGALTRAARAGQEVDIAFHLLQPAGQPRLVQVRAALVHDGERRSSVLGTIEDITAAQQEDEARRLAQRLAASMESITDAFYTLDHEWRFTYLNKQAENLFQKPRSELLGKVLWDEFSSLKGQIGDRELHRAVREHCTVVFDEFYAPYQMWSEVRAYASDDGIAVYFHDITEARNTQDALRISEERFRLVARATTDAVWDWDLVTDTVWQNESIKELFGYGQQELAGPLKLWVNKIHQDDRARVFDDIMAAIHGRDDHWVDEYRFLRKDGSIANVLDRGFIIRDQDGKALRMVGAMVDLTERRQADARIREQASLLDKAKDAIVVRGLDNRIRYWNKGAERLYGWTAQEALGRSVDALLYTDPAGFDEATRRVLEEGEWSGEIIERRKDGIALPVEVQWTLMRDEAGRPESIFAIKTDISRRKEAERRIQSLAFYDPLTQLPNRPLLMDRLRHAIAASAHSGHANALLFVDLDNFKALNDTLGHTMGDRLLQQVAQRLTRCVSNSDTVARFGGDEYVLLLENLGTDPVDAAERARAVADRILKALHQPYQMEHYRHITSASVGVTLFHDDRDDIGELLKRADLAMYQAKAAGRNAVRFFDPGMQAALAARTTMEGDLRQGLRDHEFILYYQPQVDKRGRITGVEALIRWRHPVRGLVSPVEFIPLAEETGLVLPLGEWVLEAACAQLSLWAARPETAHLEIAVNVSARQFHHPGFVAQVLDVLGRGGANHGRLKLELTETSLLDNVEATIGKMQALKQRGLSFALDDFGTGYSSLAYLKRLPLDVLKIDRSFVLDLLTNPNDAVIARTIIALGLNLGLKVVAEGVETEGQRDFLFQHGCDSYQGYLCTAPLPADEVVAIIRSQSGPHRAPVTGASRIT